MPREPNLLIDWRIWFVLLGENPARYITFDNTDGTPEEAQLYRDHSVIGVYQKIYGGTSSERITGYQRYVYLHELGLWNGSSPEEIDEFEADGVVIDANLNGGNAPLEIFQKGIERANTDDDFPGSEGPLAYGIKEDLRFNAAVEREVEIRLGRRPPIVGQDGS